VKGAKLTDEEKRRIPLVVGNLSATPKESPRREVDKNRSTINQKREGIPIERKRSLPHLFITNMRDDSDFLRWKLHHERKFKARATLIQEQTETQP